MSDNILFFIIVMSIIGCHQKTTESIVSKKLNQVSDDHLVIEGTVIAGDRNFYQKEIYSSCLVEVNTVFNGVVDQKVIEVFVRGGFIGDRSNIILNGQQIQLPPINYTAIFTIKKIKQNGKHSEMLALTPFPLYTAGKIQQVYPDSQHRWSNKNIEKELYQKLEGKFKTKRKRVNSPATFDEVAISHSIENELLIPNRQTGLVFKLDAIQHTEMDDYLGFNLHLTSANSVEYLHQGAILVEYNTEAFGDSIVTNGFLNYEIPRNYEHNYGSWYNAIPNSYDVNIVDVTENTFKIEWINTGPLDSLLQLFPRAKGVYAGYLYFKPINKKVSSGLKMTGIPEKNLKYNYLTRELSPFDYLATQKIPELEIQYFMPATIHQIFGDTAFEVLDTIQLVGKNFAKNVKVEIPATSGDGRTSHRIVTENYVLSRTDTLIKMIIPPSFPKRNKKDFFSNWIPASGKVKLTKWTGSLEAVTYSKVKLKIRKKG